MFLCHSIIIRVKMKNIVYIESGTNNPSQTYGIRITSLNHEWYEHGHDSASLACKNVVWSV